MKIVFANQAPTLMNMLSGASAWDLSWVPTGDHGGVSEMSLLSARRYAGGEVEAALVCAPSHIEFMSARFPRAKLIWVAHNGYVRPPDVWFRRVHACIAFSDMVRSMTECATGRPTFFISPSYKAERSWSWKAHHFVTIRSRPSARIDDVPSVAAYVLHGRTHIYYGQDQPGGFVSGSRKMEVMSSSSAYASLLHRSAGFGLAEHEAMSLGSPLLGSFWGDMEIEARDMPSLRYSIRELPGVASILATDQQFAEECSAASLDYISTCRTESRMNETIASAVEQIRSL